MTKKCLPLILDCKSSAIICRLNAQSLLPKIDEVRDTLRDAKRPVILGVSETWLDQSVSDGEVNIQLYTLHRRDHGGKGGGVLVYVSEMCHSRRRTDLEDETVEALWVEVNLKENTLILCKIGRASCREIV